MDRSTLPVIHGDGVEIYAFSKIFDFVCLTSSYVWNSSFRFNNLLTLSILLSILIEFMHSDIIINPWSFMIKCIQYITPLQYAI